MSVDSEPRAEEVVARLASCAGSSETTQAPDASGDQGAGEIHRTAWGHGAALPVCDQIKLNAGAIVELELYLLFGIPFNPTTSMATCSQQIGCQKAASCPKLLYAFLCKICGAILSRSRVGQRSEDVLEQLVYFFRIDACQACALLFRAYTDTLALHLRPDRYSAVSSPNRPSLTPAVIERSFDVFRAIERALLFLLRLPNCCCRMHAKCVAICTESALILLNAVSNCYDSALASKVEAQARIARGARADIAQISPMLLHLPKVYAKHIANLLI